MVQVIRQQYPERTFLTDLALRLEHAAIWLENCVKYPHFGTEDDDILYVADELREIAKQLRVINGQKGGVR